MLSSLFFLSNAVHALWKEKVFYGISFFLLTVSSLLVRLYPNDYSTFIIIDRAYISVVIVTGLTYFLELSLLQKIVPLLLFLFISAVYTKAYLTDSYSFDPDPTISCYHQCLIHCLSSIGHHFLLLCLP